MAATWAWGPMPRASAELDMTTEWGVSARADAMAVEYLNTSAPVFGSEPVIYGTPASAASLVDSVGQSTAWAAAPYPGDIMVGAADNGNGALVGAGLPGIFASYPFYVETTGSRDKVQDQSGNRLVAHSEQYMSSSDARSGLITGDFLAALQAQAATRSSVDPTTGDLTAIADSRLDAFRFTDKLQIGRSVAHAKVVKTAGQDLVKESSFTIGSIIVNGVEMSYGDGGFKFGDQAPSSPGDPKPLFDALKSAGITVEILPATGTENSIESAGMKISQVTDYGSGKQRISFIIGRVSAAIRGEAKPATEDPLFGGLPGTGPTGTESASTDPSTSIGAAAFERGPAVGVRAEPRRRALARICRPACPTCRCPSARVARRPSRRSWPPSTPTPAPGPRPRPLKCASPARRRSAGACGTTTWPASTWPWVASPPS